MNVISKEEVVRRAVDVLVVDDNPNDTELTLRGIKKTCLNVTIFCVKDGVEALDFILKEGEYSNRSGILRLVLLDLKLPKLNGLEVLEEVRKSDQFDCLPIIILSSSKEESDVSRSCQLGANSYLVKPVDYDEYMDTIVSFGKYWLTYNQIKPKG